MKRLTSTLVILSAICLMGCQQLDDLLLDRHTREEIIPASTNIFQQGTNWIVQIMPAQTNLYVTVDVKPEAKMITEALRVTPVDGAALISLGIGLLLSLYRNLRQGKINKALMLGVNAGRLRVQAESPTLDESFIREVIARQEEAGVRLEVDRQLRKLKV